jgi:hypothetical protein
MKRSTLNKLAPEPAIEVEVTCPTDAEPVTSDFKVTFPVKVVYKISLPVTFKIAPGEISMLPVPVMVGLVVVPISLTVKELLTVRVTPVMVRVGIVCPVLGPNVIELTLWEATLNVGCLFEVYATTPICTKSVATGTIPKLQLPVFAHFVLFDPPAAPVQLFMDPTANLTCVEPVPNALVAVIVYVVAVTAVFGVPEITPFDVLNAKVPFDSAGAIAQLVTAPPLLAGLNEVMATFLIKLFIDVE